MRVRPKKNIILIVLSWLVQLSLPAQSDTINQRIVLIGDAGQLTNGKHPVVDAVKRMIPLDNKTTILFLGDNLYKTGLPDRQFKTLFDAAKAVLDSQILIAQGTDAKVYMIPGNHDWENGSRNGYDAIMRQQLYVDFRGARNVEYYPKDGCPGPEEIVVGQDKNIVLILFDSQWWLHPHDKPEIESDCKSKTTEELVSQIRDIATQNSSKLVILASHHPFKSNGTHGGFFTLKQHIFPFTDIRPGLYIPLPIIGSAYPIARSVFGTPQDLKHPVYADMIEQISDAVKSSCPNVIFVAGHDHNLQYIRDSGYNYIVSGGGCKQNRTSRNKNTLFNTTSNGFAVLDVSRNNNVSVSFYTVTDSIRKEFTGHMLNFRKPIVDSTEQVRVIEDPYAKYKDTITISASDKLPEVRGLKKFFMGQNYRKEWSVPVNMKVLKIGQEKGGFRILSLGGGRQTRSLRLQNLETKKEWVLRAVSKNPSGTIPDDFKGLVTDDISTEMTSASHPYGAMVIAPLAHALELTSPRPELFFVPDDPSFGIYRQLFANKICMLEERDPSRDLTDTKTTAKVFDKMLDDNDHLPDESAVLRARLLDFVIGDYDRHFDQWRWGIDSITRGKEVKGKIYYPIPRDRDQAFFYSDGLLLKLVSNRLPFLKGFQKNIHSVNWLGYRAKDFDRIFLKSLDKEQWKNIIAEVQQKLTDSVIRQSVHNFPKEIDSISGQTLADKMISRRNQLSTEALRYYRFISARVNVLGSNQKEFFKVSKAENGIRVKVYEIAKGYDTSFVMYERVFDPAVTKEIRLYGLNDDDHFEIDSNISTRIKIRMIGGRGTDTFSVKSKMDALMYDLQDSLNFIIPGSFGKNRFSDDPPLNERSILGFNYNTLLYPKLTMGYNSDDSYLIGAAISKRTYGFRNYPYASDQLLSVLYAPARKAVKINYNGEFNHITHKLDLLIHIHYAAPQLRNFFGLGNNTEIDKSFKNIYYQVKYRFFQTDLLLRRRVFENLHLMIGPAFQSYSARYQDNENTFIARPGQTGLDSARVFSNKSYLGGKFVILLDNRNNDFFPTRGMEWRTEFVSLAGLRNARGYTGLKSDMTLYASMSDPPRFITVMKIGGARIYSKDFEYFQASELGINTGLQGFRKNRFAGKSSLYGRLEFRYKLFNINSYILPGPFGLIGFIDAGRVWLDGERSRRWHSAYGGGFYFIPFNLFMISATAGYSENERMFHFSIGTKMNITY